MSGFRILCAALLGTAVLSGAVGCRNSASETPWPVEPIDAVTNPEGEDLVKDNVLDTTKLPDNYSKDGGAAEPKPKSDQRDGKKTDDKKSADAPAPF